jgi:hypothetical protein
MECAGDIFVDFLLLKRNQIVFRLKTGKTRSSGRRPLAAGEKTSE